MSLLYQILAALGLVRKRRPRRRRVGYAHPSHDPNWPGHKAGKRVTDSVTFKIDRRDGLTRWKEATRAAIARLDASRATLDSETCDFVAAAGDSGASFGAIDRHVLARIFPKGEAVTLAGNSTIKEYLRAHRKGLSKNRLIKYDPVRPVWVAGKPSGARSRTAGPGRVVTAAEAARLHDLGLGDGWRRAPRGGDVIAWLHQTFKPVEFEIFCVAILRQHDVSISITAKRAISGADGGFDGVGTYLLGGKSVPIAMQAKRFSPGAQVGYDHTDRFVGGMLGDGIEHGFMMTTGTFSANAKAKLEAYASRGFHLELIDKDRLIEMMAACPKGFGLYRAEDGAVFVHAETLLRAGSGK